MSIKFLSLLLLLYGGCLAVMSQGCPSQGQRCSQVREFLSSFSLALLPNNTREIRPLLIKAFYINTEFEQLLAALSKEKELR